MKTHVLKLKAVLLALAVACSAQAQKNDFSKDSDGDAIMVDQNDVQPMDLDSTSEEQFVESMFLQVRDAVKAIADLVESFVDKNNKESFSAFITRCQDRLTHIEKNILAPLKAELSRIKEQQPGSTYHKILELTFKLANEMAYKELQTLHTILDTHKKSDKAKNATALVGALKPHLTKLTSIASLDLLDQKLTEIHNLLLLEKHATVTQELDKLKKMVKDIKTKTATIQNKVNIELLPIISAKLKKP